MPAPGLVDADGHDPVFRRIEVFHYRSRRPQRHFMLARPAAIPTCRHIECKCSSVLPQGVDASIEPRRLKTEDLANVAPFVKEFYDAAGSWSRVARVEAGPQRAPIPRLS